MFTVNLVTEKSVFLCLGIKSLHVDKQLLIVANAHMHWDPEYSDVKLIQTMMFVSELKNILEKASSRPGSPTADPNSIPLVLCADLNSLPDSGKADYCILIFNLTFLDSLFSTEGDWVPSVLPWVGVGESFLTDSCLPKFE